MSFKVISTHLFALLPPPGARILLKMARPVNPHLFAPKLLPPNLSIRFHSHDVILPTMKKRTCRFLVNATFALGLMIVATSAARAGDPIVGTWKLDVGKSKLVPSLSPPRAQTEAYRELPSGEIQLELTRIDDRGTSVSMILTWPAGGGVVQDQRGSLPKGVTAVETLLAPGDWYVTFLMDGKQTMTMHKVISRDKKVMRQTLKGVDPQGRYVEQIQVLYRQ
jgi:hypothetical protein